MKNNSISVIVPCFNEADNIPRLKMELIPLIDKLFKDYEIILVDDGSIDDTFIEMKRLKRQYNNIIIIAHNKNLGLGSAIRTGINAAKKDLLVIIDSDLTFHPSQIYNLIECFNRKDVDCVIGSPYLTKNTNVQFHRRILSKIVNLIYAFLLGNNFTSVSSIFRLYKMNDLKSMNLKSTGFTINAEILFCLLKNKKRVIEIPAILTTRKLGVSKIKIFKEINNHIKMFYNIFIWRLSVNK